MNPEWHFHAIQNSFNRNPRPSPAQLTCRIRYSLASSGVIEFGLDLAESVRDVGDLLAKALKIGPVVEPGWVHRLLRPCSRNSYGLLRRKRAKRRRPRPQRGTAATEPDDFPDAVLQLCAKLPQPAGRPRLHIVSLAVSESRLPLPDSPWARAASARNHWWSGRSATPFGEDRMAARASAELCRTCTAGRVGARI